MSTACAGQPEVLWGPLQKVMFTSTLAVAMGWMRQTRLGLITLREVGMGLGAPDRIPVVPAESAMRDWL